MDQVSYALGLGIGRQLSDMGAKNLNIDDFAQAIKDILAGKKPQVDDATAQRIVQEFFQEQEKKQRAAAAEQHKTQKEQGERYLAENAKKEGVVTLPSVRHPPTAPYRSSSRVFRPRREAVTAAAMPAGPAPHTIRSQQE